MTPKLNIRKCKVCAEKFKQQRLLQCVCSPLCAIAYANVLKEKNNRSDALKSRKETKVKLDKLKTRQEYLKDAQRFFNQYIRLRDEHLPCISCGRYHAGQYHAGHYRTVGSAPQLRFSESNVHKQCSACNNHLSGNIVNYRKGLVQKIGMGMVDNIESYNEPKHYSVEEIIAIKTKYKNLIREMKNGKSS